MKYYICEATQYKEPVNGKTETFSMNARDTEREAKSIYHKKMSTAMDNDNVINEVIHVMDEKGGKIVTDCYEVIIPEPEPELEEQPEENPGE